MRATPRADESIRPTQLDQVFSTRLLGAESCLQIRQGSGVIFLLHTGYHNTLGLLESTKYPSTVIVWWRNMIPSTAMLVVGHDNESVFPVITIAHGCDDLGDVLLSL